MLEITFSAEGKAIGDYHIDYYYQAIKEYCENGDNRHLNYSSFNLLDRICLGLKQNEIFIENLKIFVEKDCQKNEIILYQNGKILNRENVPSFANEVLKKLVGF